MYTKARHKVFQVALPLLGSAILLISCSGGTAAGGEQENILTMRGDTMTRFESQNGALKTRFYTPMMEEYKYAPSPYTEFPRGIDLITYDTLGGVKSTLVANYALFWMDIELWELKGDVRATNEKGDMLETPQLFWNQKTRRIYSNNVTRLTQNEDVLVGEGFESDEDMYEWEFRKPRGVLRIDAEPNRSDSTAVAMNPEDMAEVPAANELPQLPEAEQASPVPGPTIGFKGGLRHKQER